MAGQVTLSGSSHWHRLPDLISNPTDSLSDDQGKQSYSLRPGTAAHLPALQQPPGLAGEQAWPRGRTGLCQGDQDSEEQELHLARRKQYLEIFCDPSKLGSTVSSRWPHLLE